MSDIIFRRKDCRLCGGNRLELALPLAASPIGDAFIPESKLNDFQDRYPLDIFLCGDCGHVQLLDVIDPKILYNDYIYTTTSSPGLPEHFKTYADEVLSRVELSKGSLAVDIGSNDGTLLKEFQTRGLKVLGVEPARVIAEKATASGVETLPSFFNAEMAEKIRDKHGLASLVTTNNLFANVDDLVNLVSNIRSLLADDGVFIIETGYLVDLVRNTIFDNVYHEHLGYHSVEPLRNFLAETGLEMIHAARVPSKGGSLRATIQLEGGPRPVDSSVDQFVRQEQSIGAHSIETYQTMAKKLKGIKSQLAQLVEDIKGQGKTVAGYGASQSGTTLMYHFGLQDSLNFIVDDNPVKQGLFSPGCHIPVLPSAELETQKPDYVITLAWRFSKSMIGQHQQYRDRGGKFIVPLPDVEVV